MLRRYRHAQTLHSVFINSLLTATGIRTLFRDDDFLQRCVAARLRHEPRARHEFAFQ